MSGVKSMILRVKEVGHRGTERGSMADQSHRMNKAITSPDLEIFDKCTDGIIFRMRSLLTSMDGWQYFHLYRCRYYIFAQL